MGRRAGKSLPTRPQHIPKFTSLTNPPGGRGRNKPAEAAGRTPIRVARPLDAGTGTKKDTQPDKPRTRPRISKGQVQSEDGFKSRRNPAESVTLSSHRLPQPQGQREEAPFIIGHNQQSLEKSFCQELRHDFLGR